MLSLSNGPDLLNPKSICCLGSTSPSSKEVDQFYRYKTDRVALVKKQKDHVCLMGLERQMSPLEKSGMLEKKGKMLYAYKRLQCKLIIK